jgi:hypothetical protein
MPPHRKIPLKLSSILNQSKSTRQLRQNSTTALFPMLAKSIASWDDDNLLEFLKNIPDNNLFANKVLPAIPLISETVIIEKYYIYPEFSSIFRRIHEEKVNLPENLTNLIHLFIFFYLRSLIETFVRATNKYAEKKIKLKRRKISELSIYNRYLYWKPLTIRNFFFLRILILIGSNRKSKFKNY